ncbi:MAG: LysM domain-containing protein [Chloroflexi bacterium]|nr:MAG: LysM domain-containing protein [Chloroflexota bacterium]
MRSRILVLALIMAMLLMLTAGTLSASASGCRTHYVQWGETLYSIGRMYGVDPYAIAAYNGLSNPNYVKGGTYLCIPYGPPYPGGYYGYYPYYPSPSYRTHYVQEGETLYSIGRLYNVDPYAIAQANGLYNPDYVKAGWTLYIPYGPPYPGYYGYYYDGYGYYDHGYYDGDCYGCHYGGYPDP